MMTQAFAQGTTEGQNVYGDTYVSGAARVHLGNVYMSNSNTRGGIEHKKEAKEAFMRSLSFPEMDHRYHSVDPAVSGTCQWFLQHEHYKEWEREVLDTTSYKLLWLRGKPGSGKSTIMKRAFLDARSKPSRLEIVAGFFFNSRGTSLEHTPEGFFRSVLHQILAVEDLETDVEPLATFLRKYRLMGDGWDWTGAELRTLFQQTVARRNLRLILYVDALDECDVSTNRDLVDFLTDELAKVHASGTSIKICLSSRHYPNIHARNCHTIIAEDYNDPDIMRYAEERLQKIDLQTSSMPQEIARRSSGIFLWAVLIIRKLREATEDGEPQSVLHGIIASTPRDLQEVFRSLLGSITEEHEQRQSLLLLLFVLCAKRPMYLEEMALALAFTKRYHSQREYLESLDVASLEQLQRLITKRSRGLVEVSGSSGQTTGIVQFIHGSVKEFLLENSTLLLPHLSNREKVMAIANDELARSCFNLVRVRDPYNYSESYRKRGCYHGLLEYAAYYGFEHAEEAEKAGLPQTHVAEALGLTSSHRELRKALSSIVQQEDHRLSWELPRYEWNPLFVCCHHRLISVFDALPATPPFVNPTTEPPLLGFTEKLFAAFNEGHEGVRAALLAKCSSNCHHDLYGSSVYNAVMIRNCAILELLLHNGANPNAFGDHGSALNLAASSGHVELVHLLLMYSADPDFSDEKYGHPLLVAASEGHVRVVELLLYHNANLGLRGRCFWGVHTLQQTHALEEASFWGHEAILSLLLEAAGRTHLSEDYYREADTAARSGAHINCIGLIQEAAKRRSFVDADSRPGYLWYEKSVPASLGPSPKVLSRREIEVRVKVLAFGVPKIVRVREHCQGIALKMIIHKMEGLSTDYMVLVLDSINGVRRITDEERLCDIGVRDGSRIEVLLRYRASTCWIEDQPGIDRALRISAREARQHRTSPANPAVPVPSSTTSRLFRSLKSWMEQ